MQPDSQTAETPNPNLHLAQLRFLLGSKASKTSRGMLRVFFFFLRISKKKKLVLFFFFLWSIFSVGGKGRAKTTGHCRRTFGGSCSISYVTKVSKCIQLVVIFFPHSNFLFFIVFAKQKWPRSTNLSPVS